MDEPTSPPKPSILSSGEKFAKEEAKRATVTLDAEKPEGQAGEATVTIATGGETEHVAWSFGSWIRRKFTRNGWSTGVKGEVKF
jgi:hypothetical protein